MFEYFRGILKAIYPTYIVLEVNNIGYQLSIANPFRLQTQLKNTVKLFIHQVIREDSHTLYAFESIEEKLLFLKLISVSGIGPKSALSILASEDSIGLVEAIENSNIEYLIKFPGVGKKTASQIILDLKGKLNFNTNTLNDTSMLNSIIEDTKLALSGLGYSEKEIKKVIPLLEKESPKDTSSALSISFKLLLKK